MGWLLDAAQITQNVLSPRRRKLLGYWLISYAGTWVVMFALGGVGVLAGEEEGRLWMIFSSFPMILAYLGLMVILGLCILPEKDRTPPPKPR